MESDNLLNITINEALSRSLGGPGLIRPLCAMCSTFRSMCFYLGKQLIAEVDGGLIGFIQIIDPAREETLYRLRDSLPASITFSDLNRKRFSTVRSKLYT